MGVGLSCGWQTAIRTEIRCRSLNRPISKEHIVSRAGERRTLSMQADRLGIISEEEFRQTSDVGCLTETNGAFELNRFIIRRLSDEGFRATHPFHVR
jgi:hypothetical protein